MQFCNFSFFWRLSSVCSQLIRAPRLQLKRQKIIYLTSNLSEQTPLFVSYWIFQAPDPLFFKIKFSLMKYQKRYRSFHKMYKLTKHLFVMSLWIELNFKKRITNKLFVYMLFFRVQKFKQEFLLCFGDWLWKYLYQKNTRNKHNSHWN